MPSSLIWDNEIWQITDEINSCLISVSSLKDAKNLSRFQGHIFTKKSTNESEIYNIGSFYWNSIVTEWHQSILNIFITENKII